MIEVSQLTKTKTHIQGLSFAVEPGERVAVVGPNGAGKSTLLRILYGLLRPDSGTVKVLERDPHRTPALRLKVAMAFQNPTFEGEVSLGQALGLHARLFGIPWPRVEAWAKRFGLPLGKTLWALSGGQARRAELVKALSQDAQIYLLDEPSAELDEEAQGEVLGWLERARAEGKAVLFTTHDPHLARQADRRLSLEDDPPATPRRDLDSLVPMPRGEATASPRFLAKIEVRNWRQGLLAELRRIPGVSLFPQPSEGTLRRLGLPVLQVEIPEDLESVGALTRQAVAAFPEELFMQDAALLVRAPSEEDLFGLLKLLLQKGVRLTRFSLEEADA